MNKKVLVLFVIVCVSIATGVYFRGDSRELKNNPYSGLGGDFTLKSSEGEFKLSDLRGQAVIIYFGFTSCPDVCPLSLNYLAHALSLLSVREQKKIVPVFVSVDWKRDSVEDVDEYTSFFSKNIVGLTGSKKQIDQVVKKYGAYYQFTELKNSTMEYTVDHTNRFYLIDDLGRLRDTLNEKMGKDEFIQKVKLILEEF
jgi:protein SCO1/2